MINPVHPEKIKVGQIYKHVEGGDYYWEITGVFWDNTYENSYVYDVCFNDRFRGSTTKTPFSDILTYLVPVFDKSDINTKLHRFNTILTQLTFLGIPDEINELYILLEELDI